MQISVIKIQLGTYKKRNNLVDTGVPLEEDIEQDIEQDIDEEEEQQYNNITNNGQMNNRNNSINNNKNNNMRNMRNNRTNMRKNRTRRMHLNEQNFNDTSPYLTTKIAPSQKYNSECKPMRYRDRFNNYGLLGSIYN